MMHRLFLAALFFISTAIICTVSGAVVRGKITDSNTLEPLHGVYVLYGRHLGTTSDENGLYFINTGAEKLSITFQFIGYESVTREIDTRSNDTIELNIAMEMKLREIDQIVVSADKTEKRIAELSVSMDVVKSSFLSENHITDAQEIINKVPGIEVMDGQASVRGGSGFSYGAGSRVLALIDGLPMMSADAGNIKWQYLPLENMSQIEIIKGASSVLYGSSALNGIINFRTAEATNIPVTQFFTESGIYDKPKNRNWVWWDTPRIFSTASFSHLRKSGKTDLGIGANIFIDEGYRRLNGEKLGRINLKLKHFSSKVDGLNYGLNVNAGYNIKKDFVLWEDAETGALKQYYQRLMNIMVLSLQRIRIFRLKERVASSMILKSGSSQHSAGFLKANGTTVMQTRFMQSTSFGIVCLIFLILQQEFQRITALSNPDSSATIRDLILQVSLSLR